MTTLDEPGDLLAIRKLILAHQGREHSVATTIVLVRLLLENDGLRSEAARRETVKETAERLFRDEPKLMAELADLDEAAEPCSAEDQPEFVCSMWGGTCLCCRLRRERANPVVTKTSGGASEGPNRSPTPAGQPGEAGTSLPNASPANPPNVSESSEQSEHRWTCYHEPRCATSEAHDSLNFARAQMARLAGTCMVFEEDFGPRRCHRPTGHEGRHDFPLRPATPTPSPVPTSSGPRDVPVRIADHVTPADEAVKAGNYPRSEATLRKVALYVDEWLHDGDDAIHALGHIRQLVTKHVQAECAEAIAMAAESSYGAGHSQGYRDGCVDTEEAEEERACSSTTDGSTKAGADGVPSTASPAGTSSSGSAPSSRLDPDDDGQVCAIVRGWLSAITNHQHPATSGAAKYLLDTLFTRSEPKEKP